MNRTNPWSAAAHGALTGDLVALTPLTAGDVGALEAAADDPAVWRWLPTAFDAPGAVGAWVEERLAEQATGAARTWVTRRAADGEALGSTSFLAIAPAHRRLEIGWTWLSPRAQRTGMNVEAKRLQLALAFDVLGCNRVEFKTDAENEKSRAALTGIGARFEGIHRAHMVMRDGRLRDTAWYSILSGEWPEVRERLDARLARNRHMTRSADRPA
jgi:RimJ/RimL family protein N-acetyltransferase